MLFRSRQFLLFLRGDALAALARINVRGPRRLVWPAVGARHGLWLAVITACVIGLTGINAYRAAVQSITHDEAVTYDRYVRGPLYRLVTSTDANNHILHSLLCRAAVGVCGPSEFVLRFPSVVAGFFLLVMVGRVGWRVWGPSPTTAAAILLVGLNPFVMDYLSIARGYSLAMALWVAALDRLLAAWYGRKPRDVAGDENPLGPGRNLATAISDRHVRRASQLLALSVLANLTFVLAALALSGCWACLVWRARRELDLETKRQSFHWLWQTLGRPGAIVFVCLALPLVKCRPSHFYFGADNLADSIRTIVGASFAHHPETWPWDNQSPWFERWLDSIALRIVPAVATALLFLWVSVGRRLWHKAADSGSRIQPGEALFYLSSGTFCAALGLLLAMHAIIGMKLPIERTGLYLLPPFCLALLSAGSVFSASARSALPRSASVLPASILHGTVIVGGLSLCVVWAGQLRTDHYRSWAYEIDSRQVFQQIVSQHHLEPKQHLRVGATWMLVPSLNFYRDVFKADYVERIERRTNYPADVDVYVVLRDEYGGVPPDEPVVEIYRGTASGTVVATPLRRAIAMRPETAAQMD